MTKPDQQKSLPLPLLLVYGKPTSADLPQASWFRAEDRPTVVAGAQRLRFSVLDIPADSEPSLLVGVHEGALKGEGRMIVGSVAAEVYKRIEEYAAKAASVLAAQGPSDTAAVSKPGSEQIKNIATKAPAGGNAEKAVSPLPPPNPWDNLRVGARVLAAYWGETREFEGFWLATVKRIDKGEFTLEWFEAPDFPPFKARPKNIAMPHPEFRPSGK